MTREIWLAIIAAVLVALGAIGFDLGMRVTGAAVILIVAMLVAAYVAIVVRPATVPRDGLLHLRLAGSIREYAVTSPLQYLMGRGLFTLHHFRQALEAAASDYQIKAVMVEIAGLEVGYATAHELHDLLARIASAGKRVIAVVAGDSLTPREYLVACGAGEIVANPDVAIMMLGVSAGNLFLKQALDKLEVQAQVLQWKEYKGAAETFTREEMSPALRESVEAMVGEWQDILAGGVARSRKLDPGRARELLNSGFMSAREACEKGLIDRLGYAEDVRDEFDPDGEGAKIVSLPHYIRHLDYEDDVGRRARIALVYGVGPVIAGEAPRAGEFLSGEETAREIARAVVDKRVRAIVFRVNSPGGSAVGSELVWRAVHEAQRKGKPVVVSMGDVAGSGGYYVAMGAEAIVAEPGTVTGSIGVVYTKFNLGNLFARLGVKFEFAKSADVSDALSWSRAMSEAELAQLDRVMGELYGNFTAKVAEGRRLDPERAENLARGRIWSGAAAKTNGLIDNIGGLSQAIELAREKAKFEPDEPHELVTYPPPHPLARFTPSLGSRDEASWAIAALARASGVPESWAPALIDLLNAGGGLLLCRFF
ncbi:MAG: signal peptide peptidase SppA [Candidatus Binataceae bacterium]